MRSALSKHLKLSYYNFSIALNCFNSNIVLNLKELCNNVKEVNNRLCKLVVFKVEILYQS